MTSSHVKELEAAGLNYFQMKPIGGSQMLNLLLEQEGKTER